MGFIPGYIVRYKNKTTEYTVVIDIRGTVCIRNRQHGGEYTICENAEECMIKLGYDDCYKVPKLNMEAFMRRNDRASCSPQMRKYVEYHLPTGYQGMDTSGFDALKSAGRDDAIDAMTYAALHDYNKKDVIVTEKMLRHEKNYNMGVERMQELGISIDTKKCEELVLKYNKLYNKENKMSIQINSLVAKNTDNIKEAQLVTKYFGHELDENSIKDEYFVRDNYDDLLKEAKDRQKEEDALAEKSCA